MALSNTRVSVEVSSTQSRALDLGTATYPFSRTASISLANGTGAGMADLLFTDERTLSASATEDIDLSGLFGSPQTQLTDAFGQTVVFARVKAIIVEASTANTNNVNVIRPASNGVPLFLAASDGVAVRPGGFYAWGCTDATAAAVAAGTADLITFTNSSSGTSVTYRLTIIGASA